MNKSKIETVLRRARALVKRGWTKRAFARNKYGHEVALESNAACRFCAEGAIRRVTGETGDSDTSEATRKALPVLSGVVAGGIAPAFNDLRETKKADVIAAFDRAIAVASKR